MRRFVCAAVVASAVLAGAAAWAQESAPASTTQPAATNHLDRGKRITFNFERADLSQVLAYLSRVAGITFLMETTVVGEVTIVNQEQLTVEQAFQVLDAVLKTKGATCVVNETRFVKIVPLSEAKRRDLPVYVGIDERQLPVGESFVTQVVPLRRARAQDLARELRNLLGTYGDLSAGSQGNVLIITDTASNVRRLLQLIQRADSDREAEAEMRVFKLLHADAKKVAEIIKAVLAQPTTRGQAQPVVTFRGRGEGGPGFAMPGADATPAAAATTATPVRVTVDDRLNAVIVVSTPEQMKIVEEIVRAIDVAPEIVRLVVEVVHLERGDATETAKVLTDVFKPPTTSRTSQGTTGGGSFFQRMIAARTGGDQEEAAGPPAEEELKVTVDRRTNSIVLVGTPEQVRLAKDIIQKLAVTEGEQMDILLIKLKNAQAATLATALRNLFREASQAAQRLTSTGTTTARRVAEAADVAASGIAGETVVVPDPTTNTLMIVSNPRNFPRILEYVKSLDEMKPQVYINALIGEITLDDDTELGLSVSYLDEPFRHGRGTGTYKMDFGVTGDLRGGSIAISYEDLELVVRALETEGKLHVLSRPHILTLDNQTARITDGERVPFIQSSRVTDVGSVFNTITYEDIGIILEVTPQINPDGFVNMVVRQEISRITGRTVPISETVNAPTFASRAAETTVSIRDGQTIVIGGLIAESEVSTIEGLPFLSKIPLLGYLFRRSLVTKQRKELLLIITPRVVRSEEELAALSDRRRRASTFAHEPPEPGRAGPSTPVRRTPPEEPASPLRRTAPGAVN